VAHDLKNPLMGVTSWSALLREQLKPLDPGGGSPAAASLTRIERAADRMGSLIDDLLNYSQATSVDLQPQPLELSAVVDRVVADLHEGRLWAPAEVSHDGLPSVCADPTLTHQLFANLLANSVKYVPEGRTPVVRVAADRVGERVEVSVSDNGIGIPEEMRDRVFDSFFRAHTDYPGTGLGLAICQRAVERHGGHITAEANQDGPGTTIRFSLPAVP
jgi:signal transduction histidine kinase